MKQHYSLTWNGVKHEMTVIATTTILSRSRLLSFPPPPPPFSLSLKVGKQASSCFALSIRRAFHGVDRKQDSEDIITVPFVKADHLKGEVHRTVETTATSSRSTVEETNV